MKVPVQRWAFRGTFRYAAAVASEVCAPVLRSYAHLRARSAPAPPATWRRAVILGSAHIGDILYRTPSLPYLRNALPDCRITYVCAPQTAELLTTNPFVDEVLPVIMNDATWRRSADTRAILREQQFDAALCTDHVTGYRDLWLAVALGIPNRVSFVHKGFSGLATVATYPPAPQPAPAFFRQMVARIADIDTTWDLTPQLTLTADDHVRADAVWAELAIPSGRVVVACSLTSRQPDPVWPARSYLQALEILGQSLDLDVILCGSASDRAILQAAASASTARCHVVAGRLGLRPFAAFLRRCDAFLGTDSGPRHIANAIGTPVVFVRRLAISRVEAGKYCENETDVAPDVEWLPRAQQIQELTRLDPHVAAAALKRALLTRQTQHELTARL